MDYYNKIFLKRPILTLLFIIVVTGYFGSYVSSFRLDASADSLVLENDQSLVFYREMREIYGSDDYLILTYTPEDDLFSETVLARLAQLRNEIAAIEHVNSVISLLDVPLLKSPVVDIGDIAEGFPTLESERTVVELARKEFQSSRLYKNLLISQDAETTAMQINLTENEQLQKLLLERNGLLQLKNSNEWTSKQAKQLEAVNAQYNQLLIMNQNQQSAIISELRAVMSKYQDNALLHLGGVPMITSDSIAFISHDLVTFGIGVLGFLIVLLSLAFRKIRWVCLPLLTCFATIIVTVGILGLVDWPVTVVSSNFVSLLVIITLSLTVHLIVRYREHHSLHPHKTQKALVLETIRAKFKPCFYTAITTIVAFGSLVFSDIRPVIDFGWMMTIGVIVGFILVFTLFPVTLMFMTPGQPANRNDFTDAITHSIAKNNKRYDSQILIIFFLLTVVGVMGINDLTVENRFIDYFKKTTDIYQGMELIDNKLGGTTPLDVIINAPSEFNIEKDSENSQTDDEDWGDEDNETILSTSYWFNTYQLSRISSIHSYLESLTETGKVLSVSTALETLKHFDEDILSDDFSLAILYKKLPDDIKQILFQPYISEDGNQIRFSIRVFESDYSLKREELLNKIQNDLISKFDLENDQVQLTGMLVLYNNMLQSLFDSQIKTIVVVFLAILGMFVVLFRNIKVALVSIVPNIFAASLMLGLMGWLGIPLDLMTITIAAITIGIAVDDTIHYIHRFTVEFSQDADYWASVFRSHSTIGRAMYYTSITIALGFSILALSNFVPTIYFGLLTSFAMMIALLANLTLLPLLLIKFKPLK